MTEQEIQDMKVEEIIHLPYFQSLTSHPATEFVQEHWEIRFDAERISGKYMCFGKEILHPTAVVYKPKK